jgi:hypothetical protein
MCLREYKNVVRGEIDSVEPVTSKIANLLRDNENNFSDVISLFLESLGRIGNLIPRTKNGYSNLILIYLIRNNSQEKSSNNTDRCLLVVFNFGSL